MVAAAYAAAALFVARRMVIRPKEAPTLRESFVKSPICTIFIVKYNKRKDLVGFCAVEVTKNSGKINLNSEYQASLQTSGAMPLIPGR